MLYLAYLTCFKILKVSEVYVNKNVVTNLCNRLLESIMVNAPLINKPIVHGLIIKILV